MPELISSEYKVYLSPDEQDAYDEMKKQFILDLPEGEISAANAAALSGKLSQMANGAIYDDAGNTVPIHEQKLMLWRTSSSRQTVSLFWWPIGTSMIWRGSLKRACMIGISRFSKLDKADSIRRWNNGEIPVALIHPASAGHGLNLQTGGKHNRLVRPHMVLGALFPDHSKALAARSDCRNCGRSAYRDERHH